MIVKGTVDVLETSDDPETGDCTNKLSSRFVSIVHGAVVLLLSWQEKAVESTSFLFVCLMLYLCHWLLMVVPESDHQRTGTCDHLRNVYFWLRHSGSV